MSTNLKNKAPTSNHKQSSIETYRKVNASFLRERRLGIYNSFRNSIENYSNLTGFEKFCKYSEIFRSLGFTLRNKLWTSTGYIPSTFEVTNDEGEKVKITVGNKIAEWRNSKKIVENINDGMYRPSYLNELSQDTKDDKLNNVICCFEKAIGNIQNQDYLSLHKNLRNDIAKLLGKDLSFLNQTVNFLSTDQIQERNRLRDPRNLIGLIVPEEFMDKDFIRYLQIFEKYKTKFPEKTIEELQKYLQDHIEKVRQIYENGRDGKIKSDENGNLISKKVKNFTFKHYSISECKKDIYKYYLQKLSECKCQEKYLRTDEEFLNANFNMKQYSKRYGAERFEETYTVFLDIDNIEGTNALRIFQYLAKKYGLNSDNTFVEYSDLGSGGIHAIILYDTLFNSKKLAIFDKLIQNDVAKFSTEYGNEPFKVEIRKPNSNTCLPFSTDYYPISVEKLLKTEIPYELEDLDVSKFQLTSEECVETISKICNFEYFKDEKACKRFKRKLEFVKSKIIYQTAPILRKYSKAKDGSERRKSLDEICQPMTCGKSNKQLLQQVRSCLANGYRKEQIIDAMKVWQNKDFENKARIYKESNFEYRINYAIDHAPDSRKNPIEESETEVSKQKFYTNYEYLNQSGIMDPVISVKDKLLRRFLEKFSEYRPSICKRDYFQSFMKLANIEVLRQFLGKYLHEYERENVVTQATSSRLWMLVTKGFSVNDKHFKDILSYILDCIKNQSYLLFYADYTDLTDDEKVEYEFVKFALEIVSEKELDNINEHRLEIERILNYNLYQIKISMLKANGLSKYLLRDENGKIFHCTGFSQFVNFNKLSDFEKYLKSFFKHFFKRYKVEFGWGRKIKNRAQLLREEEAAENLAAETTGFVKNLKNINLKLLVFELIKRIVPFDGHLVTQIGDQLFGLFGKRIDVSGNLY